MAKINGVKLEPGTYAAGSTVEIGEGTLADYLVDTGTDGELIVGGVGLSIVVRLSSGGESRSAAPAQSVFATLHFTAAYYSFE